AAIRESRTLASVKSLVTIGEADLRLVSVLGFTVVQGEPSEFEVQIPSGFEIVGVTGASLERRAERPAGVLLVVRNEAHRRPHVLLSLERANSGGSQRLVTGFPSLPSAQRETGEVAVTGTGTFDVSSPDTPGLRRMDVREVDPVLASAAQQSLAAA